ncbi:diguanylate cyclase [Chitinibacter bivalviorum]|uniref:diguanylate cyclase n=1 Tax=Chitinibacter bivalviorum TaxID=2739434 RepID=A0A7H9BFR1_9NEIS|nr:diguanylate cyclase [Chitinibacter bivalviorum]QLG87550.1 diguanylate cyclase [Chitinibacter bivalviorum]
MSIFTKRLIYFVAPNIEQFAEIGRQLHFFGFEYKAFNRNSALLAAMHSEKPCAMVIDETGMSDISTLECLPLLKKLYAGPLFLANFGLGVDAQLAFLRAGITDFIAQPLNLQAFIDRIDLIDEQDNPSPFKVLLVDDSDTAAKWTASVLSGAGMVVKHIDNPLTVMPYLANFKPDILLLDVYMPECTGDEIAKVIRQTPQFDSIPIVFLSTETHRGRQLMARSMGGDDFLVKNMEPDELIAAVTITAERYRRIRRWMTRDSLTGLLNHTHVIEALSREVTRAHKESRPLSYAMVDIDFFKRINDQYGHSVGDRVIKSLSRLLKQSMPNPDAVGRYGGEEFALIWSDHTLIRAAQRTDELRVLFQDLAQSNADGHFNASFSAGVAQLKDGMTAQQLIDAADQALYQAKAAGRNQIGLSSNR